MPVAKAPAPRPASGKENRSKPWAVKPFVPLKSAKPLTKPGQYKTAPGSVSSAPSTLNSLKAAERARQIAASRELASKQRREAAAVRHAAFEAARKGDGGTVAPKGLGNEVVSGKKPAAWEMAAAKRVPIKAKAGAIATPGPNYGFKREKARKEAAAAGRQRANNARMQARGIAA